jgi:hypothetical protein
MNGSVQRPRTPAAPGDSRSVELLSSVDEWLRSLSSFGALSSR